MLFRSGLSHECENVRDGHGFLIEAAQYAPALAGSAVPWTSGREHKELLHRFKYGTSFIPLTRDRGHGRVTIDEQGEAVPWYSVDDEVDVANLRLGMDRIARLHAAAEAQEMFGLAAGLPRWRRSDDLDAFIARLQRIPLRAGGHR